MDQVPHHDCLIAFAPQLVVDAVEALCGGVSPFSAASFDRDHAAVGKPPEQGRYGSNVHAGAVGDLSGIGRLPEVDHCKIDAAFDLCETVQVGAKVLGMLVDQRYHLLHQVAQGAMAREPGYDDQEPGVPAGQDLQSLDLPFASFFTAGHLPKSPTLVGV